MEEQKPILIGQEWLDYLVKNDFHKTITRWDAQTKLYSGVTFKHINILKVGDYYFCLKIRRGYKNITSLKRLISIKGL